MKKLILMVLTVLVVAVSCTKQEQPTPKPQQVEIQYYVKAIKSLGGAQFSVQYRINDTLMTERFNVIGNFNATTTLTCPKAARLEFTPQVLGEWEAGIIVNGCQEAMYEGNLKLGQQQTLTLY